LHYLFFCLFLWEWAGKQIKVTDELIEKVKSGNWKPDEDSSDTEQQNAMAARDYWQAFQAVKESVKKND
jgi:hypothetical protein